MASDASRAESEPGFKGIYADGPPTRFGRISGGTMLHWLAAPCLAVACSLALSGLAGGAELPALRVGLPALPASLDPATALEGPTPFVCRQVFDTLLQYRDASSDVEAGLAVQWAVSRQGLSWTFRLRESVRLHDGSVLTSAQVVAGLRRVLFPGPRAPNPNAAAARLLRGAPGVIKDVRANDSRTVQIDLVLPYAPLPTVLAHPALAIAVPAPGADGSLRLVGSGPFVPLEVSAGRIVLGAHRDHWGGAPRTAPIEIVADPTPIRFPADLEARGLHVLIPAAGPPPSSGARSTPGWHVGYLALQTERDPFRRKKVRQALAAALEPTRISGAVGRDAVPLQSFLPPGVRGRREGSPIMLGSPDATQRLLAEAGLRGRTAFTLLFGTSAGAPTGAIDHGRLAQAVQASLGRAGFSVELKPQPWETALVVARSGEHDAAIMEADVAGGDPHLLLYPLSSTEGATKGPGALNLSFFRNPHLDDLLIRGSQLSFAPERLRVYSRAQAMLADEVPWIPLYVQLRWVIARREVKNLRLHPSGAHRLDRLTLEPED
jgi:peptide/nickel transport system substrate-binding protein